MREYELVVLLHPDLEIDLDKPLSRVEKIITDNGGKVIKRDNWGKRKLAYEIKKQEFAIYVYYELELPTDAVQKIDSNLNITDEVLRHLLTTLTPKPEEEIDESGDKAENKTKKAGKDE